MLSKTTENNQLIENCRNLYISSVYVDIVWQPLPKRLKGLPIGKWLTIVPFRSSLLWRCKYICVFLYIYDRIHQEYTQ